MENEEGSRMREHEETADGAATPETMSGIESDDWALASDDEDLTYAGSTGGALVDDSRRVLVALLQGPYLDGRRDPQRYGQLLRDRAYIEQRLADMFLDLVLDDDAQVAFVRQSEDDPDAPKLLRRLTGLNRLDTVLLLVLRQHLLTQSSRGQRAVVSEAELLANIAPYRRSTSTDEAGFAKDIRSSIAKIQRAGLLEEQGDSFEVSPVLKLMINPDTARTFIDLYERAGDDVTGAANALDDSRATTEGQAE
ncbi:DUF4194 domain-containing protein [Dermabacter sp. p3-SID358]|uniref:DUF4194 domain-containing protein n=1 Tax=Dermabacter sp. p3-SID358 TaxID=2916114 RepID=UPI0021A71D65|nr:DUF4194 domain-containing protein [Dermabacter sp. p3-SID358]MCT1866909.1 DUF4194 domain-containing protein [Dermabacter sp. p3-SID358]